jgi:hypothetical protein
MVGVVLFVFFNFFLENSSMTPLEAKLLKVILFNLKHDIPLRQRKSALNANRQAVPESIYRVKAVFHQDGTVLGQAKLLEFTG